MGWTVYILRCGDGTLYTGCTNDLPRRLEAHQSGRGAKDTPCRWNWFIGKGWRTNPPPSGGRRPSSAWTAGKSWR